MLSFNLICKWQIFCHSFTLALHKTPSHWSSYVGFFRWVYEKFRLPIAPVYGGFPVKFRTFLGDPILYDPNINATDLAEKVSELKLLYCLEFPCTVDILEKQSS